MNIHQQTLYGWKKKHASPSNISKPLFIWLKMASFICFYDPALYKNPCLWWPRPLSHCALSMLPSPFNFTRWEIAGVEDSQGWSISGGGGKKPTRHVIGSPSLRPFSLRKSAAIVTRGFSNKHFLPIPFLSSLPLSSPRSQTQTLYQRLAAWFLSLSLFFFF